MQAKPSQILDKINFFDHWLKGLGPPIPPQAQGCASAAWDPKGSQITPFCHQMSRHGTIWGPGTHAEFPCESRQDGPAPQSQLFSIALEPMNTKM